MRNTLTTSIFVGQVYEVLGVRYAQDRLRGLAALPSKDCRFCFAQCFAIPIFSKNSSIVLAQKGKKERVYNVADHITGKLRKPEKIKMLTPPNWALCLLWMCALYSLPFTWWDPFSRLDQPSPIVDHLQNVSTSLNKSGLKVRDVFRNANAEFCGEKCTSMVSAYMDFKGSFNSGPWLQALWWMLENTCATFCSVLGLIFIGEFFCVWEMVAGLLAGRNPSLHIGIPLHSVRMFVILGVIVMMMSGWDDHQNKPHAYGTHETPGWHVLLARGVFLSGREDNAPDHTNSALYESLTEWIRIHKRGIATAIGDVADQFSGIGAEEKELLSQMTHLVNGAVNEERVLAEVVTVVLMGYAITEMCRYMWLCNPANGFLTKLRYLVPLFTMPPVATGELLLCAATFSAAWQKKVRPYLASEAPLRRYMPTVLEDFSEATTATILDLGSLRKISKQFPAWVWGYVCIWICLIWPVGWLLMFRTCWKRRTSSRKPTSSQKMKTA